MNDKELAGAVVALGVVTDKGSHYEFPNEAFVLSDELLVRDWRVAGPLMQRWLSKLHESDTDMRRHFIGIDEMGLNYCCCTHRVCRDASWVANESLPRAIIEACVEAIGGH